MRVVLGLGISCIRKGRGGRGVHAVCGDGDSEAQQIIQKILVGDCDCSTQARPELWYYYSLDSTTYLSLYSRSTTRGCHLTQYTTIDDPTP